MRIGMVGGVERNEGAYRDIAERWGHELHFHSGHMAGRGSDTLTSLAASVQLLIIVTDVNSHGAVILARRVAHKHGTPVVLHRRCSPSRFQAICAGLQPAAVASAG
jgi:hypothetical protein